MAPRDNDGPGRLHTADPRNSVAWVEDKDGDVKKIGGPVHFLIVCNVIVSDPGNGIANILVRNSSIALLFIAMIVTLSIRWE